VAMFDSGDRLISVNNLNLEGFSHTTTVDILQNAPDDVTLIVSQPKERLYKGKHRDMNVFLVFLALYVVISCNCNFTFLFF